MGEDRGPSNLSKNMLHIFFRVKLAPSEKIWSGGKEGVRPRGGSVKKGSQQVSFKPYSLDVSCFKKHDELILTFE